MRAFGKTGFGTGSRNRIVSDLIVTVGSNVKLCNQYLVTYAAVRAFGKTAFGTGRPYHFIDYPGMTKSINCFLRYENFIASVTVRAFGKTGFGTGSRNRFVNNRVVTESVRNFLCYESFATSVTVRSLGKTGFGTGSRNSLVNNHIVTEFVYVITVVGVVANRASICGVALLGAGRIGYDLVVVVSVSINVSILVGVVTYGAGVCSVALFGTGGSGYDLIVVVAVSINVSILVGVVTYGAGVCGVTLLGTSGIGYYCFVAMTESVNSGCFTAHLVRLAELTVNHGVVRAGVHTVGSNVVLGYGVISLVIFVFRYRKDRAYVIESVVFVCQTFNEEDIFLACGLGICNINAEKDGGNESISFGILSLKTAYYEAEFSGKRIVLLDRRSSCGNGETLFRDSPIELTVLVVIPYVVGIKLYVKIVGACILCRQCLLLISKE